LLHRRRDMLNSGIETAAVGLGLFIGFGLFFENVLNIDGGNSDTVLHNALPLMAVGLGVLIVLWNLRPGRSRSDRAAADAWSQTPPAPPTPPSI